MHTLNIFFFFILSLFSITFADNSCIFKHPTKGVIDLTSIGLKNGQPRFRNLSSSLSPYYIYSFNPCFPFTDDGCRNVAVCQITTDRSFSSSLAIQNSSKWTIGVNDAPILTYTHGLKTVSISMNCSSNHQDRVEILGENPENYYSMVLHSHCACWNACITPVSTTTSKSPSPSSSSSSPPATTTKAIYYNACKYHNSRYGTIDLSSIGNMNGTATFKDIPSLSTNNIVWSYNPCYTFSELSCRNVAGCRIDKTQGISYPIGLQENAYWININNTNNLVGSIVYPLTTSNQRLIVQLICDQSSSSSSPKHQLSVLGETSFGEYTMQLTSPCACWNGCVQPTPDSDQFNWTFWMIAGSIGCVVFVLFCMMISCLFCSKPKRSYPPIDVDEKTPIYKGYH